ncbi:MAG TPA: hypothetical protein PK156_01235 [Polyangium sp.]|nr:hypothetical protein [Polyangium sp.]
MNVRLRAAAAAAIQTIAIVMGLLSAGGCDEAELWFYGEPDFEVCVRKTQGALYDNNYCYQQRWDWFETCINKNFVHPDNPNYRVEVCEDLQPRVIDWCTDPADPATTSSAFCEKFRLFVPNDEQVIEFEKRAGAGALFDPDTEKSVMRTCVAKEVDFFDDPQPVWFGPKEEAPKECPTSIGVYGEEYFFDLHDPGVDGCQLCGCEEIEGYCPANIQGLQIQDGVCNAAITTATDFSPPEGWDGSCSPDRAISAGMICPTATDPGNHCVQSISVPSLPPPVQDCQPIEFPVPKLITDRPRFTQKLLSCVVMAMPHPDAKTNKDTAGLTCITGAPSWHSCIRRRDPGIFECPQASEYKVRIIAYDNETSFVDTRSCTKCECEPSGGSCSGELSLGEDGLCTDPFLTLPISSDRSECANIYPSGRAVGSMELTNLAYEPGSCEAKGGSPMGEVVPNDLEAVTWCCLAEEPEQTPIPIP